MQIKYPCSNYGCKEGNVEQFSYPQKQNVSVVCDTCQGTGVEYVNVSFLVSRDINMGDHGEVRTSVLDIPNPETLTLLDFVTKVFEPKSFNSRDILNVTMSKNDRIPSFYQIEETIL